MQIKKTLPLVAVASLVTAFSAWGSGFALYEPSTVSHAMGGALVGKAMDASANYNNPATLSDLTNTQVTVGFVTEHPRCQVRGRTNGYSWGNDQCMDPGLFWLPHLQVAVPLPWDFTFGLSGQAEYGLGSNYGDNWKMAWNSTDTTVQGYVLNPNVSYKILDGWSVGAGLRWLFFDFEQYSRPNYGVMSFANRLKGDNRWNSFGWQVGTKYDITDTFSVGAVYKSAIDVTVDGKTSTSPAGAADGYETMALQKSIVSSGHAEADLTLPQSVTLGCNWDVVKTWHLGAAVSWTEWSQFDTLHFDLAGGDKDVKLAWRDTWRGSLGSCWDFAEDWKWMISYTYDMDCTTSDQSSTMLPPADRHIGATGFAWNCWAGLELALSYSCIFMDGRGMDTTDSLGNRYHMETCRGFCHAVGFSVTYRF